MQRSSTRSDGARVGATVSGMTPIVIGAARGRLVLLGVCSLAFVVAGGIMLVLGHTLTDRLVAIASIAFFGMGLVLFVRQWLDAAPRIVVSDEGVFDRTLRVGTIPWDDIASVALLRVSGNPFLALRLYDPEKYTSQLGPVQRRLVEANRALGAEHLNVNLVAADVEPEVFAELVLKELELRRTAPGGYR